MIIENENNLLSGVVYLIDWLYKNRNPRLYPDYACTLRINCGELLVMENKPNERLS